MKHFSKSSLAVPYCLQIANCGQCILACGCLCLEFNCSICVLGILRCVYEIVLHLYKHVHEYSFDIMQYFECDIYSCYMSIYYVHILDTVPVDLHLGMPPNSAP